MLHFFRVDKTFFTTRKDAEYKKIEAREKQYFPELQN